MSLQAPQRRGSCVPGTSSCSAAFPFTTFLSSFFCKETRAMRGSSGAMRVLQRPPYPQEGGHKRKGTHLGICCVRLARSLHDLLQALRGREGLMHSPRQRDPVQGPHAVPHAQGCPQPSPSSSPAAPAPPAGNASPAPDAAAQPLHEPLPRPLPSVAQQGQMRQGRDGGDRLLRWLSTAPHPLGFEGLGWSSPLHPTRVRTTGEHPCLPLHPCLHPPSHLFLPCHCHPRFVPTPATTDLSLQPLRLLPLGPCLLLGLAFLLQPPFLLPLPRQGVPAALLLRRLLRPFFLHSPAGRVPQHGGGARVGDQGGSTHLSCSSCSRRSRSSRSRCSRAWRRFSASSRAASSRSVVPAGALPGGVAGAGLGAAGVAAVCTQHQGCSRCPQPRCPPSHPLPTCCWFCGHLGGLGGSWGSWAPLLLLSLTHLRLALLLPTLLPRPGPHLGRRVGAAGQGRLVGGARGRAGGRRTGFEGGRR